MPMTEWLQRLISSRAPSRPVTLSRIGVAVAALLEAAHSGETLLRLDDPGILRAPYIAWAPPMTDGVAWILIGLWIVSATLVLIGWHTRLAAALLTATIAAVLLLDQQLYSNHLYLIVLVCGLLTVADSGAALSLDALRIGERREISGWPVWLLRLQVSVVYGYAALSKLNPDFLSGSVVASFLRRAGPLAMPDSWRFLEPMLILSVLAICTEAFLAVALWSRRWRPAALVVALALHIGITGWLEPTYQLLVFSLATLPLLILFLDATPASRVVVWDDGCGFCAAWVRWFRRLDWLAALRFVPRTGLAASGVAVGEDAAARALQLVSGHRVHGGFAAVGRVLEILPISFLWAPLLRLPPIAWVGERAYRRVAQRRTCELPVVSPAVPTSRKPIS
jgi:predicted DCC family thiol-disulfide oxidoreductase YuxK